MKEKAIGPAFLVFCAVLFLSFKTVDVYGSTISQLQEAERDKEAAEQRVEGTQEDIEDLNKERIGLQNYLDQLNEELSRASGELSDIEALISEKETELVKIQEQLKEAKKREKEQYDAMKERIKFMYEKGDSAYLELFFHAQDFADFLNKNEYVEKMNQYDRNMLEEYMKIQETIRQNEQTIVDERVALGALQQEAINKQNEVTELVKTTSSNVEMFQDEISKKEKELLQYELELEEKESDIATLQAKLAEEQKITQQALAAGFSDLSSITFAAGDLELLAAIIYCEAGNQPYVGQVAVGNVVMNRVKSSVFPNTVLEVIYQRKQFSPVGSGRFAIALANHKATPACYAAARDAMAGSAPVGNCLFFRTPIPGLTGIQIGGHIFY